MSKNKLSLTKIKVKSFIIKDKDNFSKTVKGASGFSCVYGNCETDIRTVGADCIATRNCGIQTTDCGIQTTNCGIQTVDCGIQTADCGLISKVGC